MNNSFRIRHTWLLLQVAALLSSCAVTGRMFDGGATIHYVGEELAAGSTVAIFYEEQDVKRPFRVIGRMTNDIIMQYDVEDVKQQMQKKAAAVGADAIIILDITPVRVPGELDKLYLKAKVIKYL